MNTDKELAPYQPTTDDEVTYITLLAGQVLSEIQYGYTNGKYDIDTYNMLFKNAQAVHSRLLALSRRLEEKVSDKHVEMTSTMGDVVMLDEPKE